MVLGQAVDQGLAQGRGGPVVEGIAVHLVGAAAFLEVGGGERRAGRDTPGTGFFFGRPIPVDDVWVSNIPYGGG